MLEMCVKMMCLRSRFQDTFRRVLRREEGATVAEYALILAVVVTGLILVLGSLREKLAAKITEIMNQIDSAPVGPGS